MLIRTLLIWLLALAIPAQGAAASTMAFCGAGHHGGTAAATADDAAAGHVHGGHLSVAALEDPQAASEHDIAATSTIATVFLFISIPPIILRHNGAIYL